MGSIAEHPLFEFLERDAANGSFKIGNRPITWLDADSLMNRREKVAVPVLTSCVRQVLAEAQVRWQIGIAQ
jgi:hypothetical protein